MQILVKFTNVTPYSRKWYDEVLAEQPWANTRCEDSFFYLISDSCKIACILKDKDLPVVQAEGMWDLICLGMY